MNPLKQLFALFLTFSLALGLTMAVPLEVRGDTTIELGLVPAANIPPSIGDNLEAEELSRASILSAIKSDRDVNRLMSFCGDKAVLAEKVKTLVETLKEDKQLRSAVLCKRVFDFSDRCYSASCEGGCSFSQEERKANCAERFNRQKEELTTSPQALEEALKNRLADSVEVETAACRAGRSTVSFGVSANLELERACTSNGGVYRIKRGVGRCFSAGSTDTQNAVVQVEPGAGQEIVFPEGGQIGETGELVIEFPGDEPMQGEQVDQEAQGLGEGEFPGSERADGELSDERDRASDASERGAEARKDAVAGASGLTSSINASAIRNISIDVPMCPVQTRPTCTASQTLQVGRVGDCIVYQCFDVQSSATVQPYCNDDDRGKVYGTAASLITLPAGGTTRQTYTDVCVSSTRLREYYCSGTSSSYETVQCPTGTSCQNGACRATTTSTAATTSTSATATAASATKVATTGTASSAASCQSASQQCGTCPSGQSCTKTGTTVSGCGVYACKTVKIDATLNTTTIASAASTSISTTTIKSSNATAIAASFPSLSIKIVAPLTVKVVALPSLLTGLATEIDEEETDTEVVDPGQCSPDKIQSELASELRAKIFYKFSPVIMEEECTKEAKAHQAFFKPLCQQNAETALTECKMILESRCAQARPAVSKCEELVEDEAALSDVIYEFISTKCETQGEGDTPLDIEKYLPEHSAFIAGGVESNLAKATVDIKKTLGPKDPLYEVQKTLCLKSAEELQEANKCLANVAKVERAIELLKPAVDDPLSTSKRGVEQAISQLELLRDEYKEQCSQKAKNKDGICKIFTGG